MRDYDGFILLLDAVTVLLGKHVNLTLVHAELAHISFNEEDVGALHARVQDL